MINDLILNIQDLSISFVSEDIEREIIHSISFSLHKNEILGIVGESGSGKSVSSLAILGLLPKRISKITNGSIQFNGKDLVQLSDKALQKIRGKDISMIFQESMSSLNPSMRWGTQVEEILLKHTSLSNTEARLQILSLFEKVKLPLPERIYKAYPHDFRRTKATRYDCDGDCR